MMRRETAYKLAGRHHEHPVSRADLIKNRQVRFKTLPPGQVEAAFQALTRLAGVRVERDPASVFFLNVQYSIQEYCLENIEGALREAGFALDEALYSKLVRALVYFCEETERHNLLSPERLIKQADQVYVQVWGQHAHGDHDETPLDLREYR